MQKIEVLFVFLLFYFKTLGQGSEINRLHDSRTNVVLDTTFVLNAITSGANYQNVVLDSALYYTEIALSASRKIKYPKGEVLALNLEGVVLLKLGNYSK